MDTLVDIPIPVDAETARALQDPERRQAAGRYLKEAMRDGSVRTLLTDAIADLKREAHGNGLTDEIVEAELEQWRRERTR